MNIAQQDKAFTSQDIVKETGLTYRQLDYWVNRGALRSSVREAIGQGSLRLFSDEDRRHAHALKALVDGWRLMERGAGGPDVVVSALSPESIDATLDALELAIRAARTWL